MYVLRGINSFNGFLLFVYHRETLGRRLPLLARELPPAKPPPRQIWSRYKPDR